MWKCVSDIGVPITRIGAEVACLATDGKQCLWGTCKRGRIVKRIPRNVNPLKCGADHKAKYGSTGYDNPSHWCAKGNKILSRNRRIITQTVSSSAPVRSAAPTAPTAPAAPAPAPVLPAPAPEPVYSPIGPSSYPVSPPVSEPVRSHRRPVYDYIFYLIDLLVSIMAITVALLSTRNMDNTSRIAHVVVAILFRYVYLGYFLINKARTTFKIFM